MIHTNPEHLRRSGAKLGDFGERLADGSQQLESAGGRLVTYANEDRSGIGSVISKAFGKGVQITSTVFSEGGRVAGSAGKRTAGNEGVLVVLNDTTIGLNPVHPDALADALVGQSPTAPAAHRQSITVPTSDIDGAPRGGDEKCSVHAGQQRNPAVQQFTRLVARPRTGGAQLYVAVRDGLGRRWRCPFPLNVIDTDAGRWFVHRQRTVGCQVWLTASPATPQVLVTKLVEMYQALSRR